MNDCNTLFNLITTGVDVLVFSSGRPEDVTVLRTFPVESSIVDDACHVVFDVQNVADRPLVIAPVVTAVFRGGGYREAACDILDKDRLVLMGTTKR